MANEPIYLASDNWSGAHPKIVEAMTVANHGAWAPYGQSDRDAALDAKFSELFETKTSVFLCTTGTAANALAIASMMRPGDVFYAHHEAHVRVDECGAPIFLSPGLQIDGVAGAFGKMNPQALATALETTAGGGLNAGRIGALGITQATEAGTLYTPAELDTLIDLIHQHRRDAPIHMDGARFANALAATNASPADMTWRRGVDILSFGGTKNGCWCAEAILVFNPAYAEHMAYIRKRAGHLASKMRFMTAQFEAYLKNGLWLKLADHANQKAIALETLVEASPRMRLAWPREINEVFAVVAKSDLAKLNEAGLHCALWQPPTAERDRVGSNEAMIRMVTSWATDEKDIEQVGALLDTRVRAVSLKCAPNVRWGVCRLFLLGASDLWRGGVGRPVG
ncbi:MAG: beta-eliminating lyase-related protein, partial [Pseudomonadota bacterium]